MRYIVLILVLLLGACGNKSTDIGIIEGPVYPHLMSKFYHMNEDELEDIKQELDNVDLDTVELNEFDSWYYNFLKSAVENDLLDKPCIGVKNSEKGIVGLYFPKEDVFNELLDFADEKGINLSQNTSDPRQLWLKAEVKIIERNLCVLMNVIEYKDTVIYN